MPVGLRMVFHVVGRFGQDEQLVSIRLEGQAFAGGIDRLYAVVGHHFVLRLSRGFLKKRGDDVPAFGRQFLLGKCSEKVQRFDSHIL